MTTSADLFMELTRNSSCDSGALPDRINCVLKRAINSNSISVDTVEGLIVALSTAENDATALNPYTIKLITDLYTIPTTLQMPSYTTLDLNGSVLQGDNTTLVSILENEGFDSVTVNTNITIKNGTIDWNRTNRAGDPTDGKDNMGMKFTQTDFLTLENLRILDTPKYGVLIHRCDDFIGDNIYFDTESDGLHFSNGGERHYINNIRGTCKDDLVAYTMTDWTAYEIDTTIEDFNSISINKLYPDNTEKAVVKLIGGISNNAYTNTQIVDNTGDSYTATTSAAHEFIVGDYIRITGADIDFNDEWLITAITSTTYTFTRASDGNATISGTVQVQRFFDNVVIDGIAGTCTNIPIKIGEDTADANDISYQHIKSLTIKKIPLSTYSGTFIQILSDISVIIDSLVIDVSGRIQVSGDNTFLSRSSAGDLEVGSVSLKNAVFDGGVKGTGLVVNAAAGFNVEVFNITDVLFKNMATPFNQQATAMIGTRLNLTNVRMESVTQGIYVRDTLYVTMSNFSHTDCDNKAIFASADGVLYAYGSCMDVGVDDRTIQGANGLNYIFGHIAAREIHMDHIIGAMHYDVDTDSYKTSDGVSTWTAF